MMLKGSLGEASNYRYNLLSLYRSYISSGTLAAFGESLYFLGGSMSLELC